MTMTPSDVLAAKNREIEHLTSEVERLTSERDELLRKPQWGAADSNVFVHPHSEGARPLGKDVQVRFGTTEDGAFDVELDEDGLTVSLYDLAGRDMAICPLSSNSIHIRKIRRR